MLHRCLQICYFSSPSGRLWIHTVYIAVGTLAVGTVKMVRMDGWTCQLKYDLLHLLHSIFPELKLKSKQWGTINKWKLKGRAGCNIVNKIRIFTVQHLIYWVYFIDFIINTVTLNFDCMYNCKRIRIIILIWRLNINHAWMQGKNRWEGPQKY